MVTRKFTFPLCIIIMLWLTACESSSEVGNVLSVQLGQPFTIRINQVAQLTEKDLSLRFQEVLEDSRYPSNVECAEAGQARISISVTQVGQSPATLELNTNPPLKQDVVTYADVQIRLLELNPYPEDIDKQIPEDAYQATLVITEAPPQLLSAPGDTILKSHSIPAALRTSIVIHRTLLNTKIAANQIPPLKAF